MSGAPLEPTERTRAAARSALYGIAAAEQWRLGADRVAAGASLLLDLVVRVAQPGVTNPGRTVAQLDRVVRSADRDDPFFGDEVAEHVLRASGLAPWSPAAEPAASESDLAPFLAIPVALHWHHHPVRALELVRGAIATTHPDADVIDASVVLAAGLIACCRGDDALAVARRRTGQADMAERLADVATLRARGAPPRYLMEFFDRSGRAVDSVPIALYVATTTRTVEEALEALEDLGVPESAVCALASALVAAGHPFLALPCELDLSLGHDVGRQLEQAASCLLAVPQGQTADRGRDVGHDARHRG
ncbi:MAG: ADP-ribosylglycohydrolase family protein [Candidatus Nanopelagicales bacterium]